MSRFRIALSFAGEKRPFVKRVAALLARRFGKDQILYDEYHEAELRGRDDTGLSYLPDLYLHDSDLIVVIACPEYDVKKWCGLEWRAIFDLLADRQSKRVMLCRFAHATVRGLYSTATFVELDRKTARETANLILQRLALNEGLPRDHYLAKPPAVEPLRAAPSRLRRIPRDLVGRDDELAALDEAWSGSGKKNVITIIAWGGVGKTSLVGHWARTKLARSDHGGIDRYFDWSFYRDGARREDGPAGADKPGWSNLFLQAALEFFGDPELASGKAGAWQKGERLAHLVSRSRTLLVLDGLESLQEAKSGNLRDEGLRALLSGLAIDNAGLCLVTTRQSIPELTNGATTSEWPLAKLSASAGAELLKRLGVDGTDADREKLAEDMKGHALSLTLLGRYLVAAHGGDIRRRDRVTLGEADYEETSGHAFRVMKAYEEWLENDGRNVELAILRILGLFDRSAMPDCLDALRRGPAIGGLTDNLSGVTDARWNVAVSLLADLGLVEEQPWEPPRIFGYSEGKAREGAQGDPDPWPVRAPGGPALDTHPLIREYFGRRLREGSPDAWRSAHELLFDHLQQSVPYWPEGLEGLQPLYQAVAHGCLAGRYDDACTGVLYHRIRRRDLAYSTRVLGALAADLAAVGCFFVVPWSRVVPELREADRTWLMAGAAFLLRGLGRLSEAREPMRAAVTSAVDLADWVAAAENAGNLSDLELVMGDLTAAVHDAELSLSFAERSGDAFQRYARRASLANILHQTGRAADARLRFEEAERLQREHDPSYPLLYSARGFHYCDLLLADAEHAAWRVWLGTGGVPAEVAELASCQRVRERALMMLHIARRMHSALSIALARLTTVRADLCQRLLDPDDTDEVSSDLDEVVHSIRDSGSLDEAPRALLTRAWHRTLTGDSTGARADLAEAELIAERGPMALFLADVYLHRARLFFRQDLTVARENLRRARALIEKQSYLRRMEELKDAEAAIESNS